MIKCPKCSSPDLKRRDENAEDDIPFIYDIACNKCGYVWDTHYDNKNIKPDTTLGKNCEFCLTGLGLMDRPICNDCMQALTEVVLNQRNKNKTP